MLATGRREGRMLIITIIVVLALLLAVVLWFSVPRSKVVPTSPPVRVETAAPDPLVAYTPVVSAVQQIMSPGA
jgi:hypothetical protein